MPNPPSIHGPELDLLLAVTAIPSASGREEGVVAFVRRWVGERPDLTLKADPAGNLVIGFRPAARRGGRAKAGARPAPLFFTAHMDHPAFVVEKVRTVRSSHGGPTVELSFRGGVMDVFFEHAPITIHTEGGPVPAALVGPAGAASPLGKMYLAEVDDPEGLLVGDIKVGDVATWQLPPAEIDARGMLHTLACDDLSAVAACLCVLERLRGLRAAGARVEHARVLLTRSEEIGFIGAIAACRHKTMPRGSRVIALENSRAFADSPIGGGPIVRVGDRLTVFTPWLTAACGQRAEELFGGASSPASSQTRAQSTARRPWQRKLMAGGACEASVFCHYGYDATCLCLPLGNYHNMANLDELQAGTYDATLLGPPRCAREFVHTQDFLGLVDLLVGLAEALPGPGRSEFGARVDKLFREKQHVLEAMDARPAGGRVRGKLATRAARPGGVRSGTGRGGRRSR